MLLINRLRVFFPEKEKIKQGFYSEKRRFKRVFSNNPSVQILQRVFKRAMHFLFPLKVEEKTHAPSLEQHMPMIKTQSQVSIGELSFLDSPEFRELSDLRKKDEIPAVTVPRSVMKCLFGKKQIQTCEEFSSVMNCLSELTKKLDGNQLNNMQTKEQFHRAMERKVDFQKKIKTVDLEKMAQNLSDEIKEVSEEKPLIYFGELSVRRALEAVPFFDAFLKEKLPEEFYQLIHSNGEALTEKVQQRLLENFSKRGWMNYVPFEKLEKAQTIVSNIFSHTNNAINKVLPKSWYEKIANSLKEDLREVVVGSRTDEGQSGLLEDIWDNMISENLQSAIGSAVKEILDQSKELIHQRLDGVVSGIANKLPKNVLEFASICNVNVRPQEHFWIEIRKQENGKYCVCFFANETIGDYGHSPLVFSDIDVEKLNADFFFLFLSHEAWPEREEGVSYCLGDVYEKMVYWLDKKEDKPAVVTPYPSSDSVQENFSDYLKRYIHHYSDQEDINFDVLYHYHLPYSALINFWPEIDKNPDLLDDPSLRSELNVILDQLSSRGLDLYNNKAIDLKKFKKLASTMNEVRLALEKNREKRKKKNDFHSMIVPEELKEFVRKLQKDTLLSPSNIEGLKEIFISVMGEDVEESVDLLLKEVFPEEIPVLIENKEKTWSETLKIDALLDLINEIRTMQFSLFHVYRVYAKISSAIKICLGLSMQASFLEALIKLCIPQLAALIPFSIQHIAQMMSLFGPSILAKILPKELYEVLAAIFNLVDFVVSYLLKRLVLIVLGAVFRQIMGDTKIQAMKLKLEKMQEQLTKAGTLSFELPQIKKEEKAFAVDVLQVNEKIEEKPEIVENKIRPYPVSLNSENVHSELKKWLKDAEALEKESDPLSVVPSQMAFNFLHEQLRHLPLPGEPGGLLFWEKIEDPKSVIETLQHFTRRLVKASSQRELSSDEMSERVVSLYSLYAIADTLARRCDQVYLTHDIKPNGIELVKWMADPCVRVDHPKSYQKLMALCKYFDIVPFQQFTDQEFENYQSEYQQDRIFYFNNQDKLKISSLKKIEALPSLSRSKKQQIKINCTQTKTATKDNNYFRLLLEKPEIKEKLSHLGIGSNSKEIEKFIALFKDEGQILPRPYQYLRFMHLVAANISTNGVCEYEDPCINDPFDFKIETVEEELIRPIEGLEVLSKMSNSGKRLLDTFTLQTLRSTTFTTSIPFIPQPMKGTEKLKNRMVKNQRGTDLFSSSDTEQMKNGLESFAASYFKTLDGKKRSQSEIMIQEPKWKDLEIDNRKLTQEEISLLEMMNSHPKDQLIRVMSFFYEERAKLSNGPGYRLLFELLITQVGALNAQLNERVEFVEDIGKFFNNLLTYFYEQEDFASYLHLVKVGQEMLRQCERYDKKAASHFPDFHALMNSKIVPHFQNLSQEKKKEYGFQDFDDGLILCYLYQTVSYRYMDPLLVTEEQKRKGIETLARLAYSKRASEWKNSSLDVAIKSLETLYLWEEEIVDALKKDSELRDAVLNGIMKDSGIDESMLTGQWEGEFPLYQNGDYILNLTDVNKQSLDHKTVNERIERLTGMTLSEPVMLSENLWSYPKENLIVNVKENPLLIYLQIEGKKYRYLHDEAMHFKPLHLAENETFWIEENTEQPTILQISQGEILARHEMKLENNAYTCMRSTQKIQGAFLERVSEEEKQNMLGILHWFQGPSSMRLFKENNALKVIEFQKLGLCFDVKEVKGKTQAVCSNEEFADFAMAPKQNLTHLQRYTDGLLIENTSGDQKLLLPQQSLQQLMLVFVSKQLARIPTSPFMDKFMKSLMNPNEAKKQSSVYAYSFDEKGVLSSSDPMAIFQLVFVHFVHGDQKKALHYLCELEKIAKRQPFTKELFEFINQMMVPLAMVDNAFASEMLLRLAAIREENELVLSEKLVESSNSDMMRWIGIQAKYYSYLKQVQLGMVPYLSEYQELFILKSIDRLTQATLAKKCPNLFNSGDKGIEGLFKKMGVDDLAGRLLMMPLISKRYRDLKGKHQEGSLISQKVEGFVIDFLFGEEQFQIDFDKLLNDDDPGHSNHMLSSIFSIYQKAQERACLSKDEEASFNWDLIQPMDLEHFVKEKLVFSSLNPAFIQKHFLYLYRLALKKIPSEWENRPELEEIFKTHVAAFHLYLPLLKGQIHQKETKMLLSILQMVGHGGFAVNPDELDQACKQDQQEEIIEKLNTKPELFKKLFKKAYSWTMKHSFYELIGLRGSTLSRKVLSGAQKVGKFALKKGLNAILPINTINKGIKLVGKGVDSVKNLVSGESKIQLPKMKVSALKSSQRLPLQETLQNKMREMESGINEYLQNILNSYFEGTKQIEPVEKVQSYDLSEIDDSLKDFYGRQAPSEMSYSLKEDKKAEDLNKDMLSLQKDVFELLKEKRKSIKTFANHLFKDEKSEEEQLIEQVKMGSKEKTPLSFEEIQKLFNQKKTEILKMRSKMGKEQIKQLEEQLYLYYVLASRFNLLFDQIKKQASPEIIARELARVRVYAFDAPERLLLGKLLFEWHTGKMIRPLQSKQFDKMLLSEEDKQVVEAIMGSGKTSFGLLLSGFFGANGQSVNINVLPSSVAKSNIEMLSDLSEQVYKQSSTTLEFSRSKHWGSHETWALFHNMKRAHDEGEMINTTKESLQSLELAFIEECLNAENIFSMGQTTRNQKIKTDYLRKTLAIIDEKGRGGIDEAHEMSAPNKELNFPLGKRKHLDPKWLKLMSKTIYALQTLKEFQPFVNIQSGAPHSVSSEDYQNQILEPFARKMAQMSGWGLVNKNELEEIVVYISGKAKRVPNCVLQSPKRKEMDLVKGMLTLTIPASLKGIIHEDFTRDDSGSTQGEQARPSRGNNTPLQNSVILDARETFVKSALMLLHDRLTEKQLDNFIVFLKNRAKESSQKDRHNTPEALFFKKHCPGFELFSFEKLGFKKQVYELLNKSDKVILFYSEYFVAKDIDYHGYNLSSNPSNFFSMFGSYHSPTGSPYDKGCFLRQTQFVNDPGTDGESVDVMEKRSVKENPVVILEKENPLLALDEMITSCFEKNAKYRAIVDLGAVLNGVSNETVARRLMRHIKESGRTDVEGVVFYLDDKQMMLEANGSIVNKEESKLSKEKYLSYYDQAHTFAAHIDQDDDAIAVVTIGENTQWYQMAQAAWRMRGLKTHNQQLVFMMVDHVRKVIGKQDVPSVRDLIVFAHHNQKKRVAENDYQADKQQMHNVVRKAILQKALHAQNLEEAIKIICTHKDVFVNEIKDDPTELFGYVDVMVKPQEVFEALRKKYAQIIKQSPYLKDEQKELINELKQIGHGKYPSQVHAYSVNGQIEEGCLNALNREATVQKHQNMDMDVNLQIDQKVEVDVNMNQDVNQMNLSMKKQAKVQSFRSWGQINLTEPGKWLNEMLKGDSLFGWRSTVSLLKTNEVLGGMKTRSTDALQKHLSKSLLATNNLLYLDDPFSRKQVPISEVLIIQLPNREIPFCILLSQEDANEWRLKLARDRQLKDPKSNPVKFGIYDVVSQSLVAEGVNRFANELTSESFQMILVQIKFLRGDKIYDEKQKLILADWLKKDLAMIDFNDKWMQSNVSKMILSLKKKGEK